MLVLDWWTSNKLKVDQLVLPKFALPKLVLPKMLLDKLKLFRTTLNRLVENISSIKYIKVNTMAGKKVAKFTLAGIEGLAEDKPVVYTILNKDGKNVYTGVAKRGHVDERIKEHLPGGMDAIYGGARVKIKQKSSIAVAKISEARIIRSQQPTQNINGQALCF